MIARSSIPLAAMLLLAMNQPAQDAVKADMDKLQGDWVPVSLVFKGKELSDEELKVHKITVKGNEWTLRMPQSGLTQRIEIDPSKDPKTIDFVFKIGINNKEVRALGIYKLEGDSLKLALAPESLGRPTELKAVKDTGQFGVWKRVAK